MVEKKIKIKKEKYSKKRNNEKMKNKINNKKK
jgi:hypothetical protein